MRTCTRARTHTLPSTQAACICLAARSHLAHARVPDGRAAFACPGLRTCSRILHSSSFSLSSLHLLMNLPKLASVTKAHWKYFSCTSAHAGYLLGFATCKQPGQRVKGVYIIASRRT